jgi:multicomponent Na+:H+ antiporter subunit E
MGFYVIVGMLISLVWMMLTNRVSLESFIVGSGVGFGIALLILPRRKRDIRWRKVPGQVMALFIYIGTLALDIVLSGFDVARRVLAPQMRINPGIIAVETQDETHSPIIAALSADVITLTPGELVTEVVNNDVLYVHCLDVNASMESAAKQQTQRLKLFKRILGSA